MRNVLQKASALVRSTGFGLRPIIRLPALKSTAMMIE